MRKHPRPRVEHNIDLAERLRARCPFQHTFTPRTMLTIIMQRARTGAVPYAAYIAAHGIVHALSSERCTAAVASWIETLSPAQILDLVAEVACACATIGEVPRYLNAYVSPGLAACA